jgi:glycosyltransferase involved in cell wall biosynthesis
MSNALTCQLDHLVASPDALFGFGWAVPAAARIESARLRLGFPGATDAMIAVSIDRPREDVAAAFPGNPHAANAGFMLLAGWPDAPPQTAALEFQLADGHRETVPLELPAVDAPRRPAGVGWRYLARRGWAHLRLGRLRAALAKFRELRRRSRAGAGLIRDSELAAAVAGQRLVLLVDHAMGGGANASRDRRIGELTSQGLAVVLLTFVVSSLSLRAELHRAGRKAVGLPLADLDELAAVLKLGRVERVIYNCGVSFPRPLTLAAFLSKLASGSQLEVVIHDYFTVCPSAFLLDHDGRFCGVPDLGRCAACLPVHEDGFVSLAGSRSIEAWRAAWGSLLEQAAEIRCFSESSRRLLDRAYPGIARRVTVRPHEVAPLRRVTAARPVPDGPLVVGVIGAISRHKGAEVVADLARAIDEKQAAVRLVVIGQVDAACPPGVVHETGPYEPADLPGLVERHGVQLALLPSICPETFSFVAHEIISMGLPLITLDVGAPADLARGQPRGRVATRADGPGLLAEIADFAADLVDCPAETGP